MALGYDGKLYILAFDHRGSFQKKMFGIAGDPTPEETDKITDAKRLIFEGMEKAVERGLDASTAGVLVDEQFGGDVPQLAREHGLSLTMPVEKSGQDEFDFQYGDDFGEHIEEFDPFASKVRVRYNPDGDAEMNKRQLDRLKRLADWLHDHDRLFLFELLVPAEPQQLESVGGDTDRYDAELRPELMRRALDLVGRAQGLPRREPRAGGGRRAGRRQLPALHQGLRRRGGRRARVTPPLWSANLWPPCGCGRASPRSKRRSSKRWTRTASARRGCVVMPSSARGAGAP